MFLTAPVVLPKIFCPSWNALLSYSLISSNNKEDKAPNNHRVVIMCFTYIVSFNPHISKKQVYNLLLVAHSLSRVRRFANPYKDVWKLWDSSGKREYVIHLCSSVQDPLCIYRMELHQKKCSNKQNPTAVGREQRPALREIHPVTWGLQEKTLQHLLPLHSHPSAIQFSLPWDPLMLKAH